MLDQETLRPVIIAMALYLALSQLIPELFKKPTNIKITNLITSQYEKFFKNLNSYNFLKFKIKADSMAENK